MRLSAASALALLRIPAGQIAHIHLSERGSFFREGALLLLARKRHLAVVATIHGASFVPFAIRHPRLVSAVLTQAHAVTCLEHASLTCVRRAAPLVHSMIMPNPVVVEDDALSADKTDELVVFAGDIGLRKGADILSRAWRIVAQRRPQARCLIVGPVTDFNPPKEDRLEVRLPVSSIEMRTILRSARVVALPARAEGAPMVLTEAMSLGRPFVGTPVGGIPELARAGGLLVPVEDASALADRLTELLDSRDLAQSIGQRGRRFCAETCSLQIIDAQLRKLYSAAAKRLAD